MSSTGSAPNQTGEHYYPHVSVVVTTYNRPDLLDRALDSIAAQEDFEDFEVIVVHDGPASHETELVCRENSDILDALGIPFRFIGLQENSGYQCVPKNVGIWHSHGDYIAFLDDDNEWTPKHLKVLVEAMEKGQQWPDFVYGRREYILDPGCPRQVDVGEAKAHTLTVGPSPFVEFTQENLATMADSPANGFLDTSEVMITKGAFWRLQLATDTMWNESLRRFGDWELFVRGIFFSGWRGKGVDEIVQRYHWHGKNLQITRPPSETPKQKKK